MRWEVKKGLFKSKPSLPKSVISVLFNVGVLFFSVVCFVKLDLTIECFVIDYDYYLS